jgi:hypothetical protein
VTRNYSEPFAAWSNELNFVGHVVVGHWSRNAPGIRVMPHVIEIISSKFGFGHLSSSSEKLRCLYESLCAVATFDIAFCYLCLLACFVGARI